MKGFLLFLLFTLMLIGLIGYYEMQHPDEIQVRRNGHWVTLKRTETTEPPSQTTNSDTAEK